MDRSVILHLNGHCIESEAKNEFKRCMDTFFLSESIPDSFEEKIKLLSDFIENSDFNKIRASDSRFEGEKDIHIKIFKNEKGSFIIEFIES